MTRGRKRQLGQVVVKTGYRTIYMPTHPRANSDGQVLEHIVIAERALGKPLPPKAQVHHWGDRADNTKLVICEDLAYHKLLHQRTDALRATGDANARKCVICGEYGNQDDTTVSPRADARAGNGRAYHRTCKAAYEFSRKRRLRNG